ncbi:MAG: twin-arginine translocase TatA/TatE family subunit [Flavobacteriales bacterium AspAUS03]
MNLILTLLGTFGTTEIVVIVILALLLFGGKKIPELMKGLGIGLKEFKKATQKETEGEDKNKSESTDKEKTSST